MAKAEEEQAGTGPGAGGAASKTLDKRRRLEEEAKNKVRGQWRAKLVAVVPEVLSGTFVQAVPPARNAFPSFSAWLVSVQGPTMP